MVSRRLAAGVVLIVVILAGLWLFNTVSKHPINTAGVVNNPDETGGTATITANVIEMTANGFTPQTLEISKGDTVTWINKDIGPHWPASAFHPTHTVYPGSSIEKCGTSEQAGIFDACQGILPGENWSFTFNEIGSWGYHDHLDANLFGKVVVK